MKPPAREQLSIYWRSDGIRGEEHPGFEVFAIWSQASEVKRQSELDIPRLGLIESAWDSFSESRCARYSGPGWTAAVWEVAVSRWPDSKFFARTLEGSLRSIVEERNAILAWVGFFFSHPPSIFDSVEVAYLRNHGPIGQIDLDKPLKSLEPGCLQWLRDEVNAWLVDPGGSDPQGEDVMT